jgi:selenocysteine-specific elongation factor
MAVEGGALRVRSGLVARPDFEPRATATEPDLARVLGVLERERLRAPSVAQLAQETGTNTLQVLKALEAKGLVVPLHRDCYVLAVALAEFRATLEALGTDGAITPARLRDWTGLSRKYLIPLLEWADRAGITVREDEGRRLNPRRNVTVRA